LENEYDIDAEEAMRHLPSWQLNYRPVSISIAGALPDVDDQVALTVHGLHHASVQGADSLSRAFLAAIAIGIEQQRASAPMPTESAPVFMPADQLTQAVNVRAGAGLTEEQLHSLLKREPATWGGHAEQAGRWTGWDLTRAQLRRYRGAVTTETYLLALEKLVGMSETASHAVALPARALPDALDHLDVTWRLVTKQRLLRVLRIGTPARLMLPVNSGDDFSSACTALADVFAGFQVEGDNELRSLQRLEGELDRLLGANAERAVTAVGVLRRLVDLRTGQQHAGGRAAIQAEKARLALGLVPFGADWAAAWDHVRWVAVEALSTIREELATLIED
jgi:hypothetical protein